MLPGPSDADYRQRGQLPIYIPDCYRGGWRECPQTAGRSSQLSNTNTASWMYRCVVEGLCGLLILPFFLLPFFILPSFFSFSYPPLISFSIPTWMTMMMVAIGIQPTSRRGHGPSSSGLADNGKFKAAALPAGIQVPTTL